MNAVASVAERLGNTPAICRKCYIHPAILAAFQDEKLFGLWRKHSEANGSNADLSDEENALLRFLDAV